MNRLLIDKLSYFKKVIVPKYIEIEIQSVALKHLKLPDMGKLKDRMEGQLYYDNLKIDLMAEYSFEKAIGLKHFDWSRREKKSYKRKIYNFGDKSLQIETFQGDFLPRINQIAASNIVFVYVNPDNRVYISGIAKKNIINKYREDDFFNNKEFFEFDKLTSLPSADQFYLNID